MRKALILSIAVLSALYGTGVMPHQDDDGLGSRVYDPLTDSLLTAYARVRLAAATSDAEVVARQMDPQAIADLEDVVRRDGYSSWSSYLERQVQTWANPDTMQFVDVELSGEYARLTLSGHGREGTDDNTVRYTFLMFRHDGTYYRLAGITGFEKDRTDLYGTPITYHETELPSRFRMPRLF